MDRTRLSTAAAGADVRFVRTLGALADENADLVVVDLSRPGVLEALPNLVAAGARVVGFGAHVDRDVLDAARAAGATTVLPRSAFFGAPDRWLA